MLKKDKVSAALYAIHSILVKARWLAGQGVDHKHLYKLLDYAEVLPAVIARPEEDTTEEFRQQLAGLGQQFPDCGGFLENFDRGVTWDSLGEHAA
jgi:hypothetical protein